MSSRRGEARTAPFEVSPLAVLSVTAALVAIALVLASGCGRGLRFGVWRDQLLPSGRVVKVMTGAGARVAKGDALLVLEAMKMEHTITAPADGVVKEVHYAAGDQVLEGAELISLE